METTLFPSLSTLASGCFVGFIFGFLLRKAKVTDFNVIVQQLPLKDFTVMKVMLTAIACGSLGIYLLSYNPLHPLIISQTTLFAAALGGALFGVGMAVMGYCPGTAIGALANGARDVWFGVAGMIVGAGLYAHLFPWITQHIKPMADISTITIPEFFHISPWIGIALVWCMLALLAAWKR